MAIRVPHNPSCSAELTGARRDATPSGQISQLAAISARSSGRPAPFSAEVASTRGKAAGRRAMAFRVVGRDHASTSAGFSLSALVRTIW